MMRAGSTIIILLLALLSSLTPWLDGWEGSLSDAQFQLLRNYELRPVAKEVVVVGIDETTIAALPEPLSLWHAHLGRFLQATATGRASAVGLDIVLPDRSFDGVMPGLDRSLVTGIVLARRSAPLVLALALDPSNTIRIIHPPFLGAAGPGATGLATLPVDPDGVVRRFHENLTDDGGQVDTLAGQMARRLDLPAGSGLIDFGMGPTFQYIPLQTALAWLDTNDTAALRQAFAGKAVMLGSVLAHQDRHQAPVALAAWEPDNRFNPGVLLHAQILRNLLSGGMVQTVPPWVTPVLALLVATSWFWIPRARLALFSWIALVVICMAISIVALAHGIALPTVPVIVTAACALGGRQLLENARQLRERMQMRRVFSGYVSPDVMAEILANKIVPALGGEQCFTCVMFSDIRGYTTRSEGMTPQQTIRFLNRYFDRIVPLIHAHGGTVVSFMGDGMMAVFGAPKPLSEPCAAAVAAAQSMLAEVASMNVEFAQSGEPPIQTGIGLHAGIGVAGHIGASSRHEYSVIGDVTNVASRLEGVTKEVGYPLVVSRAVVDKLPEMSHFAALGPQAIKGHTAIDIYGWRSPGDRTAS